MTPDVLGVMIPIIAVTLSLAIPIVGMITDYFKKRALLEALHKERMLALEKGMDPPTVPAGLLGSSEDKPLTPSGCVFRAIIWGSIGLAVLLALPGLLDHDEAQLGWIPVGVGVAYLVRAIIEARRPPPQSPPPAT